MHDVTMGGGLLPGAWCSCGWAAPENLGFAAVVALVSAHVSPEFSASDLRYGSGRVG